MFFLKKIHKSNIKRTRTTVTLLSAAILMTAVYAGCSLMRKPSDPSDSAASVSQTSLQKEDPFKECSVALTPFEGNVSRFDTVSWDDMDPFEYVLNGRYVYNLYRKDGQYELKRIDTADPSESGIVHINCDADYSCTLNSYSVRVEKADEVVFYDLDMNEICKVKNKEHYEAVVPFRDSYLCMEGDELSLVKDGKTEPFRKLNYAGYSIMCEKITPENTILVLTDNNENGPFNFYFYDIDADKYEKAGDIAFNYFDAGYYEATPKRIIIRDLSDDKDKELENRYPGYIGTSFFDGEKIYFSDQTDLLIRSYDPFKNTISTLSEYEFGQYVPAILGVNSNKLYFVFGGALFVIDMKDCKDIPVEEFKVILHGERDDLERVIRDKYSVNILTGDAAAKHILNNVKCESFDQETRILYSLKQIEPYIRRFGKEFFDEFRYGTSKGLYVLMTGHTEVTNDGAKIDAGGVAFREGDIFYIILNINNSDVGRNFCHELMHSMEQNSDPEKFFPDWKKYNPKNYKYNDSYAKDSDIEYTQFGSVPDQVYFFDTYSKTNALEDRARIFENILAVEKQYSRINEYPHLKAKATYIKERILKLYPSLKGSDIFKNLDG